MEQQSKAHCWLCSTVVKLRNSTPSHPTNSERRGACATEEQANRAWGQANGKPMNSGSFGSTQARKLYQVHETYQVKAKATTPVKVTNPINPRSSQLSSDQPSKQKKLKRRGCVCARQKKTNSMSVCICRTAFIHSSTGIGLRFSMLALEHIQPQQ